MKQPKKILRGLQEIRTISGRSDKAGSSYRNYMKVSCLEMEKFRRGKERATALERVANINLRFLEIEKQKQALLREVEGDRPQPQREGQGTKADGPPAARENNGGGPFRIRY